MSNSSLTLVSHVLCPYVQRASIVLHEKSVPFESVVVDLSNKPDWFLEISPTGKVPLLRVGHENGDETVLFESMAICEYLEETQPGVGLHPSDPLVRARHRGWIEFGSAALVEAWSFLNAKDSATAAAKAASFKDKLMRLEPVLSTGPYFDGASFSLVDAVFAPVFRFFDVVDPSVSIALFADLPATAAWRRALACRPSVIAAVSDDFQEHFLEHLRYQNALLAK